MTAGQLWRGTGRENCNKFTSMAQIQSDSQSSSYKTWLPQRLANASPRAKHTTVFGWGKKTHTLTLCQVQAVQVPHPLPGLLVLISSPLAGSCAKSVTNYRKMTCWWVSSLISFCAHIIFFLKQSSLLFPFLTLHNR